MKFGTTYMKYSDFSLLIKLEISPKLEIIRGWSYNRANMVTIIQTTVTVTKQDYDIQNI